MKFELLQDRVWERYMYKGPLICSLSKFILPITHILYLPSVRKPSSHFLSLPERFSSWWEL